MAQSSNYKQYARSTRVLTEESGFAGGMLWTGNNIDETHLKAIVNLDYDDTTGYLKTRDPFVSPTGEPISVEGVNLRNYKLLGHYNICPFDMTGGENHNEEVGLLPAGELFLFAKPNYIKGVWEIPFNLGDVIGVYKDTNEMYHKVDDSNLRQYSPDVEGTYRVTLHNTTLTNALINYDNLLYGLGIDTEFPVGDYQLKSWLQVFRMEYRVKEGVYFYALNHLNFVTDVMPKLESVSLLEACTSGFNAALGEYAFTYDSELTNSTPEMRILGVYMKDESDNITVSPRVGKDTTLYIPTVYSATATKHYLAVFQLDEVVDSDIASAEDMWKCIHAGALSSENGMFKFTYKFSKKNTTLAFVYYGANDPGLTPTVYSEKAIDRMMPYAITANDNSTNLKLKNYDLSGADGNCIWNNRMCLWGADDSHNCLFISEVDNFYYYPIPHNVAVFDTDVISCIPYKDTLLVFTANKIYRLSENNDGSFTQTVVQNDMPLSKEHAAHLTAIKNMVLFKSGNYFYMIVPKSQSLTDELTIAPIYKNIAGFLNTLDKSVQEMLQLLYPEYLFNNCIIQNNNAPTTVYSAQDTVHILYDISALVSTRDSENRVSAATRTFKMFLNYNTNLRAWTLYVEDTTQATLEAASLTTARLMSFVRVKADGSLFDVVEQRYSTNTNDGFRILLDTGYRTLSAATQKRFREVQLKLYSSSENITKFGTAFLVDGVWRRNYSKLQEVVTDVDKGTVSLMPELDLNTFITELTMPVQADGDILKSPGSDAIELSKDFELSDWTLNFSHFKREAPVTIRVPVSGKGFNPRFIFMAPNATNITVNEINWVYRLMHGR